MAPVSDLAASLQQSRDRLFAEIRGLTEEHFRFIPAEGDWNIATILAHLLRVERVYAERMGKALHEHEPSVPSTRVLNDDDPALAQRLAVPQIVHGMLNTRRELQLLLEASSDEGLQRTAMHETLGRMTIGQMADKMATHEIEHVEEIAALVKKAPRSARVIIPLAARS
jgi:uncharacterized damage-inducible protein DinB